MVYSPSSKKYIPQGQPHKNQKDAEKDAKTFEEYKNLHKDAREKINGSTTWRADLQYDFKKGYFNSNQ